MKELLLMIVCVLLCHLLMAQTFDEWFEQNDTQLRYLQEQIAALTVYTGTEESGYLEIGNGLESVDTVEEADYDLHRVHFAALSSVSPGVLADPRIVEIRRYLTAMTEMSKAMVAMTALPPYREKYWETSGWIETDLMKNMVAQYNEELIELLTNGTLQMDDAERKRAIGRIHRDVTEAYRFIVQELINQGIVSKSHHEKEKMESRMGFVAGVIADQAGPGTAI
jgi:hypothetical protein